MKIRPLHLLLILPSLLSLAPAADAQTATAPNLGTATGFALYTPAGAISNTGLTVVTGDVGTISGAVTGISTTAPVPPAQTGLINGSLYQGGAYALQVDNDVQAAYLDLAANTPDSTLVYTSGLGNKQVLKPYVYYLGGATLLDDTLFLDAQNDPNGLFIFQVNGVLNTSALSRVVLMNGADLSNVYWQVNGAVNTGVNSVFMGTVIANGAISMGNGATIFGRALSTFDAINLDSSSASLALPMPLPIRLLSFTATREAQASVRLEWTTASEKTSSSFIAERSHTSLANSWEAIATLPAAGNSASTRHYSIIDFNAADGVNYYRLRSVDINGSFSLSQVAVVHINIPIESVQVSPNPAVNTCIVKGAMTGSLLQLKDLSGRTIRIQVAAGKNEDRIETGDLAPGNYLILATDAGNKSVSIRLNKQ